MSTMADYGIPDVLSGGILQPKQKHKWRVKFIGMGGGTDSQPVSQQAITVTRPNITWEEIELHRYNSRAWIAGKATYEPITLTIEDDVKGSASKVIQEQMQRQQWIIGAQGQWLASAPEASLYKFTTLLDHLDGNDQKIEGWILEGSWLSGVDYGDLDTASAEVVTITLTIRYDNPRQDIGGYNAGQGVATDGPGVA